MSLNSYRYLLNERIIRAFKDIARKKLGLTTPYDIAISTLKSYGIDVENLKCLELFGHSGLWTTADYAELCENIDFYEIEPNAARCAKKYFHDKLTVYIEDSIQAIQKNKIIKKFDFIVIDNPARSPYGKGKFVNNLSDYYFENFDLFPKIFEVCSDYTIIMLNCLVNAAGYCQRVGGESLNAEWLKQRASFFNVPIDSAAQIPVDAAIKIYAGKIPENLELDKIFFVPRDNNGHLLLLTMCVRRK